MEETEEFDVKIEAQLAKLLSKTKEGFDKQLRALEDKFSSDLSLVQSKLDIALSRVALMTATAPQTSTAGVLDKTSRLAVTSNGTTDSALMAINLIKRFPKPASSIYLMKILLLQKNGIARRVFSRMGIDNSLLLKIAQDFTDSWPKVGDEFTGLSSEHDLEELLKRANEYKMEFRDPLVSVDHLVLALAHNKLFKVLFDKFKLTPETLKDALLAKNRYIHRGMEGINEPLAKSCKNLFAMAKAGNLDPVIGRDTEISRCTSILSRKDRNNLILIGDPGVGKTAIVHGIAQRIEERNVPQVLMDKQIILLDIIAAKEINRGGINLWLKIVMENGDDWLAPDKFQHVIFCFSIAIIFCLLASRSRYPFLRQRSIFIGSLISLGAGAAKEIADEIGFFSSAGASFKDAAADLVGIFLAVVLLSISKAFSTRFKPAQPTRGSEMV